MTASALNKLTPADSTSVTKQRDDTTISADIEKWWANSSHESQNRFLLQIKPVPRAFKTFSSSFLEALKRQDIELNTLWGLLFLNIQVSHIWHIRLRGYELKCLNLKLTLDTRSPDLYAQTADWAAKLRRSLERFNRVYRAGIEEKHEATLALIDMVEHTLEIMVESARYLRHSFASKRLSSNNFV